MEYNEKIEEFLNELRESGITNMFGAGAFLEDEFGVDKRETRKLLKQWMEKF